MVSYHELPENFPAKEEKFIIIELQNYNNEKYTYRRKVKLKNRIFS